MMKEREKEKEILAKNANMIQNNCTAVKHWQHYGIRATTPTITLDKLKDIYRRDTAHNYDHGKIYFCVYRN
jgi:hypothetical protein